MPTQRGYAGSLFPFGWEPGVAVAGGGARGTLLDRAST